ncbi:MAG: VCBS repeat-containing protein [bacterium]|nr:VCBS repeat-containing protein [bacterium]
MKKNILSIAIIAVFGVITSAFAYNQETGATFSGPGFFNDPNTKAGIDVLALPASLKVGGEQYTDKVTPDAKVFVAGIGKQDEDFIASPYVFRYSYNYSEQNGNKTIGSFCPFTCLYQGGFRLGSSTNDYEVVVTPNENAQPLLKIYDGNTLQVVDSYYAYSKNMVVGLKAAGFIDQRGGEHIAVAPNKGAPPQLRLLNKFAVRWENDVAIGGNFMVYHPDFRGGVDLTLGDVDGDGDTELVTVPETDSQALVRVFELSINGGEIISLESEFVAYPGDDYGATIEVADLDADGTDEIVTINGKGSSGEVKVFTMAGEEKTGFSDYFAYSSQFKGGARASFGGYKNGSGGQDDYVKYRMYFGAGPGGGAHIRYADFPISE